MQGHSRCCVSDGVVTHSWDWGYLSRSGWQTTLVSIFPNMCIDPVNHDRLNKKCQTASTVTPFIFSNKDITFLILQHTGVLLKSSYGTLMCNEGAAATQEW
jgi:hypothetical protein